MMVHNRIYCFKQNTFTLYAYFSTVLSDQAFTSRVGASGELEQQKQGFDFINTKLNISKKNNK